MTYKKILASTTKNQLYQALKLMAQDLDCADMSKNCEGKDSRTCIECIVKFYVREAKADD